MKVSYNWLQSHFDKKLPAANDIANALIFHSFEVESLEKIDGDEIFDLKILPDRAHDCLSHLGIANEISLVMDLPYPKDLYKKVEDISKKPCDFSVEIEDETLCRRYIARVIKNISVKESPKWLKERLESIGQRSINNIVDSANYVMFDVGQPLHAFDMDKLKGGIVVRHAKKGEKMTTLDGKDVALSEEMLVIADEAGSLAIAGVKGGNRAGVTEKTKNIVLESANFDPVSTRRTSTKLDLRTDASKRFENEISPEIAKEGVEFFTSLIFELAGGEIAPIIDKYPNPISPRKIVFTVKEIEAILGEKISEKKILEILEKIGAEPKGVAGKIEIIVPAKRLDINVREDVAEEIGRVYGYEKIPTLLPEKISGFKQNPNYLFAMKVREVLKSFGFTEMYGYSLCAKGEVEVLSPLAEDKKFLREDLMTLMKEKIKMDRNYIVFDTDPVKLFEIGTVFSPDGENLHVAIGMGFKSKKLNRGKEEADNIIGKLESELGMKIKKPKIVSDDTNYIVEFDFNEAVEGVSAPKIVAKVLGDEHICYKKISLYPRIIRDVALFVPASADSKEIEKVIAKNAGDLLYGEPILFDVFEKDGKKSLAFRIIFQSYEKTLSDGEVNEIMQKIITKLEENNNWAVRK